MAKAVIYGRDGRSEIELSAKIYEEAHDAKCTVPQYLERTYGENVDTAVHGSVFSQLLAQCNMNLTNDKSTGLGSASLREIYDGSISAAITKEAVPLSRILMPAAVLALVEKKRSADNSSDIAAFEKLLAVDTSIAGNRFEQPEFDASGAEFQEVSRIGQLQVPNLIGKLTVSERSGYIPTYSFGVEISDDAVKAMTIDQISIYLNRMASAQAAARVDMHINSLIMGDKDVAQAALVSVGANTFDAAATGGKLTHRAYVKWLRHNRRLRTISHILCDEETYYRIVDRAGRPTATTVRVEDKEIQAYDARVMNLGFTEPEIFVVNDGVLPSGVIAGIDSRFAIARIRNSEADYQASEQLIMRRGEQMRFDEGEVVYRLDDTAFTLLDIN